MIIIYIVMILLGALPLWITIRFVLLEERIRKQGVSTTGTVTNIRSIRRYKGPTTDRVHVRYNSIIPGQYHEANFVTTYKKYRISQTIPVKYLSEKPDKIVVAEKRGYWVMLIFTILIALFVIFAVFRIEEMV